jgi:hypothetical protein
VEDKGSLHRRERLAASGGPAAEVALRHSATICLGAFAVFL